MTVKFCHHLCNYRLHWLNFHMLGKKLWKKLPNCCTQIDIFLTLIGRKYALNMSNSIKKKAFPSPTDVLGTMGQFRVPSEVHFFDSEVSWRGHEDWYNFQSS